MPQWVHHVGHLFAGADAVAMAVPLFARFKIHAGIHAGIDCEPGVGSFGRVAASS